MKTNNIIYVAEFGDGKFIKVGFTRGDIGTRFMALRSHYDTSTFIVSEFHFRPILDIRDVEKEIHEALTEYRARYNTEKEVYHKEYLSDILAVINSIGPIETITDNNRPKAPRIKKNRDKMIWIKVDGTLHRQFKAQLKTKGRKVGVRYIEQVEIGRAANRFMEKFVITGEL